MQIIEKARSNPKTEDLDQLFKEMMRTLESNLLGPTELYSIPPADLIPTGLGDAELREYMQSAIKPCVDWATNVSDQLSDFRSKVDQKKAEAFSDSESQLNINQLAEFCLLLRQNFCKTLNILKVCAHTWSTHFDDSDFQEFARATFDDCHSTFQNLRSLILCIVRHPYTQGLPIDRVEDEEARRNGKPSSYPRMQHAFDYKQFIVLVVDDEEKSLKYFTRAFQHQFRILTATSADEGLTLLRQHKDEVGVLIADSRMPGHKGVWLLEQARDVKPHLVRIYWSAYLHSEELLAACRIGIHKFISCPYDTLAMEQTLRGALEQFALVDALVPKGIAGKSSDRTGLPEAVSNRLPE